MSAAQQMLAVRDATGGTANSMPQIEVTKANTGAKNEGKDELHWAAICPITEVEAKMETSAKTGVSSAEAQRRIERDGLNELYKEPPPSIVILFVTQMVNVIMLLLIASACASLFIAATGDRNDDPLAYVEGLAIFVIVFLNAGIAAFTENVANNALEALSKMSQSTCQVIRDGQEVTINSNQVVVGDIVLLMTGDVCPADVRLIEANELKVNEMLLTGEPDDVNKTHTVRGKTDTLTPPTMVFSSCQVANGKATAIVTDIGMQTRVGAIAAMLSQDKAKEQKTCGCLPDLTANQTPLQASLQDLGMRVGYLAIAVCTLVFVVGVSVEPPRKDETDPDKPTALYMILVAVTLAVAAIPEGIPLCVTISLSTGAKSMVKRNVLVRRLAAVETLGSASVICSDKTGTLTEGKMTMVKMWTADQLYDVSGNGFNPRHGKVTRAAGTATAALPAGASNSTAGKLVGLSFDGPSSKNNSKTDAIPMQHMASTPGDATADAGKTDCAVRATLLAGMLNCNTKLGMEEDSNGNKLWTPKGNSSEAPIVVATAKVFTSHIEGDGPEIVNRFQNDMMAKYKRVLEIPFNSSRKMMVTVSEIPEGETVFGENGIPVPAGSRYMVVVKGAPNIILDNCKDQLRRDGSEGRVSSGDHAKIMKQVDDLSSQALRVLAIASRFLPAMPFDIKDTELTSDQKFAHLVKSAAGLRLMGLVASIDPAREGVREAVEGANSGGIRVVMITGDYYQTAVAIAKNNNILRTEAVYNEHGQLIMNPDIVEQAALDCNELRPNGEYLEDVELDYLTSKVKVFARAKPEDKLEIVKSLQRQGLVCAMTGDGVNDAPALKKSDIGVAMGIQGTDVAKGAADMILTDDNFVSIVGAVEKGRVIYAGIQKFVAFIMSVHIGEVMQIFFCVLANIPIMRKPLQILFLILVTDLPPAVALGMEPGHPSIMKDAPRPKKQPIVLRWMWQSIVMNGLILSVVIAVVYFMALDHYVGESHGPKIASFMQLEGMPTGEMSPFCFTAFCNCVNTPGNTIQSCEDDDATQSYDMKLRKARTATFIAVVFAENVRAYTSRSFDQPVYVGMFANSAMQKAILLAQVALWCVAFIPGLSDKIFELEGSRLDSTGYVYAFGAALGCVLLCELYKFIVKGQIRRFAEKVREEQQQAELERQQAVAHKQTIPDNASVAPSVVSSIHELISGQRHGSKNRSSGGNIRRAASKGSKSTTGGRYGNPNPVLASVSGTALFPHELNQVKIQIPENKPYVEMTKMEGGMEIPNKKSKPKSINPDCVDDDMSI